MKLRNQILTLATAALVCSSFLAGCTTEDTPGTPTTDNRVKIVTTTAETSHIVTGLEAGKMYVFSVSGSTTVTKISGVNSANSTSITVFWTRDAIDNGADTINYAEVSSALTTDPVTNAAAITWATATRVGLFRMYETADNTSGHFSGLVLAGDATKLASTAGADSSNIDLVLATDNGLTGAPYLSLVSADVSTLTGISVGHSTTLGDNPFDVTGGAAMDQYMTGIKGNFQQKVNAFDVPSDLFSNSSVILHFLTADGHYGRLEIVPQTDGRLYGLTSVGGGLNRYYIDVNVSYQTMVGWGYVGRPGEIHRGSFAPIVRGGSMIHQ